MPPAPPRRITLTIDSRLEQVALVAVALRAVCALSPLGADDVDGMELGVVEAVTNVIRHGYGGAPDRPVAVSVTLGEDRVGVEIRDSGTPIPPAVLERAGEAAPEPDLADLDSLPESGMGLRLIFAVAGRVRYASDGGENRLWLEWALAG